MTDEPKKKKTKKATDATQARIDKFLTRLANDTGITANAEAYAQMKAYRQKQVVEIREQIHTKLKAGSSYEEVIEYLKSKGYDI